MKHHHPSHRWIYTAGTALLALAIMPSVLEVEAALQPKKPAPSLPVRKTSCPRPTNLDNKPIAEAPVVANTKNALYADGHKVRIYAVNDKTQVWIDYNDNNTQEANEVTLETAANNMSELYIYGGSLDKNVAKNVDIEMTGGTIGGIYGAGFAGNNPATVTGDVSIVISGGSVGYVMAGGEAVNHSAAIDGNADILLYNCTYRSARPVNDNSKSNVVGKFNVRDFSTHTSSLPDISEALTPQYDNYFYQVADGCYEVRWTDGDCDVPEGVDLTMQGFTAPLGSHIHNEGTLRLTRCGGTGISNLATWSGHSLIRTHQITQDVTRKEEDVHYQRCSVCGEGVPTAHKWSYIESTDNDVAHAQHTRICTVCNYSATESCTEGYSVRDMDAHAVICSVCNHVFGTEDHTPTRGSFEDHDAESHKGICAKCQGTCLQPHTWSRMDQEKHYSCSVCSHNSAAGHPHDYQDGQCSICGYTHTAHSYEAGSNICSVCHKGCNHEVAGGVSLLSLYADASDAINHYFRCSQCHMLVNATRHSYVVSNDGYTACSICEYYCEHQHLEGDACKDCGNVYDCQISDDEHLLLTKSLQDAFYAISHYKMTGRTITLLHDIHMTEPVGQDLERMEVTLDMNGHSIDMTLASGYHAATIGLSNGTLNVIDSQWNDTQEELVYIGNNSWMPSVEVRSGSLNIGHCHLKNLKLGEDTFGDVRLNAACEVENLTIGNQGSTYDLRYPLYIKRSIVSSDLPLGELLPVGQVLAERQGDGSWSSICDHTNHSLYRSGQLFQTNTLAIVPCLEHHITSVSSYNVTIHTGYCDRCGHEVSEEHRMTQPDAAIDAVYHNLVCSVCHHTNSEYKERHIYSDKAPHNCINEHCLQPAVIALSLQGNREPQYFGSLEEAWTYTNRPGMIDTITLLKDVEISAPLAIASETRYFTTDNAEVEAGDANGVARICVPYIYIKSNGKRLTYTGEGSPILYPATDTDSEGRDEVIFCAGTKVSAQWHTDAQPMNCDMGNVPVADGSGYVVTACTHEGGMSYQCNEDAEHHALATHSAICSLCRLNYDDNHDYNGTSQCIHCGASRVIVATVSAEDLATPIQCGSLEEAWSAAIDYSKSHGYALTTINLLADVDVYDNLYVNEPGVKLVLNGTDAGIEHKIHGYVTRSLFIINGGSLTILSGEFKSLQASVSLSTEETAHLNLQGGTYHTGTMGDDGALASYYRYYGNIVSRGIAALLAPGYYMEVTERGSGNFYPGQIVTSATPIEQLSASGKVMLCQHPAEHRETPQAAVAPTCVLAGHHAYYHCTLCDSYILTEGGEEVATYEANTIIPANGHSYVEGVCTVCENVEKTVTISAIDLDKGGREVEDIWSNNKSEWINIKDKAFDNILDAWNFVLTELGSNCYTTTITLHTDIDMNDYQGESDMMGYQHDNNVIIDLNGHDLNMRGHSLRGNYWSYYTGDIVIMDSQNAGKTCTWDINFGWRTFQKNVIIQNTHLVVNRSLDFIHHLILKGNAGVTFGEGATFSMRNLSMEPGTYLESNGLSTFTLYGDYDKTGDIAKLMHFVQYEGEAADGHTSVMTDEDDAAKVIVSFLLANDEPATRWKATMLDKEVTHAYSGALYDNGLTHGGICDQCGFITREAHDFVNHVCRHCGRKAEASVTIDGITTDYSYLFNIYENRNWVEVLTVPGALESTKGKTASLKLHKDIQSSTVGFESYLREDYTFDDPDTHLTFNFNDHQLSGTFYIQGADVTFTDGPLGQGQMSNGSICLYVNSGAVTFKGGTYGSDFGFVYGSNDDIANGIKCYEGIDISKYATVNVLGGRFSRIKGYEGFIEDLTGNSNYLRAIANDALITEPVVQNLWSDVYAYLAYDCYATSNTQSLIAGESVDVTRAGEPAPSPAPRQMAARTAEDEGNAYQPLIDQAIGNLSCKTFAGTGIPEAVDLTGANMLGVLQKTVSDARYNVMVTSSHDIESYVEATLTAMTIESISESEGDIDITTRMTFDVKPYATINMGDRILRSTIGNELIDGKINFRLPVDNHCTSQLLAVYHTDDDGIRTKIGEYEVKQGMEGGQPFKYIEVQSGTFSTFDYEVSGNYILRDATLYDRTYKSEVEELTYQRTFSHLGWNTWYVPFELTLTDEILEHYKFSRINNVHQYDLDDDGAADETIIESFSQKAGITLRANYPYLVKALTEEDKAMTLTLANATLQAADVNSIYCQSVDYRYTFTGTYTGMRGDSNESVTPYALFPDGWMQFSTLPAQRHYLTVTPVEESAAPQATPRRISLRVDGEEEANGIITLYDDAEQRNSLFPLYDLTGRLSSGTGFQIRNGKITFVK